ncbi:MAG TPA: hypothetical protein VGR62_04035, partial [Candidatus Binatia bacterium]|nr:hypothetical protein [Candidatus Binatia bacterium]
MRRALVLVLLAVAVARAEPPPVDLAQLFPDEASITVASGGLARLVLPPEVLAACRPDLSDVRVFDGAGHEVPYVVDAGPPPGDVRQEATVVDAQVLHVERTKTPRQDQPPRARETYRLAAPAGAGPWTLRIDTAQTGFVRRVDVATESGPLVENASIVRLGDPAADRMQVSLPALTAPELVVTIEGDEGYFLQPTFRFQTTRTLAETAQVTVPLPVVTSSRVGDRTVVEVERPSGVVPGLLRIATATPAFDRRVQVWDVLASGADVAVGDGRVRRVTTADTIDALDVPLGPARGGRLRVEIIDGDSPSLGELRLEAVVRQPALIFALGDGTGTLRFGGGRAYRPRYDLTALMITTPVRGADAEVATRLWDPERLATATLGPIRANPRFDASPALAFAMRAGAPVDTQRLEWRHPITVAASPNGLSRLLLSAGDLAHARPDLADIRVVDAEGHQWPFLIDRDVPPTRLGIFFEGPDQRDRASHWTLRPHEAPLVLQRIELGIGAPFFHRPFRLVTADANGHEIVLASGELVRDVRRPRPTVIDVAPVAVSTMTLVVDDGDDAPLPLQRAWADMPTVALLLAAPPGQYALLLGDPEAAPPRYELASVRDVVVALTATPATSTPLVKNPDFSQAARV